MKKIISLIISIYIACGTLCSANNDFILVIDAGHGGRDPGAVRGKIKEKDINLGVALEFGRLVEQNMPDVKVVYTRKTDKYLGLNERARLANKTKANLFVSIHTNSTAAKSTNVLGTDTYILGLGRSAENQEVARRENSVIKLEEDYTTKYEGFDPDSPESYIIFEFMSNNYMEQSFKAASLIQSDFKSVAKRVDRGVKQGGLLVLRETAMPSILIELGFINNTKEAQYLNTSAGQKNMAKAIYSGFRKYKDDFDKRSGIKSDNIVVEKKKPSNLDVAFKEPKAVQDSTPKEPRGTNTGRQTANEGTEYRVQFLFSPTQLPDNSPLFKGVKPTGFIKSNGYKYTIGATTDLNEIVNVQREVRKKFKDAFVIKVPIDSKSAVVSESSPKTVAGKSTTVSKPKSNNKKEIPADVVEYRIQFLYSPTKLKNNSSQFKGLKDVSYYKDGGYKYTVGSTTDYNEIRKLYRDVKKKFKDAFIIRMKNDKRL